MNKDVANIASNQCASKSNISTTTRNKSDVVSKNCDF